MISPDRPRPLQEASRARNENVACFWRMQATESENRPLEGVAGCWRVAGRSSQQNRLGFRQPMTTRMAHALLNSRA